MSFDLLRGILRIAVGNSGGDRIRYRHVRRCSHLDPTRARNGGPLLDTAGTVDFPRKRS